MNYGEHLKRSVEKKAKITSREISQGLKQSYQTAREERSLSARRVTAEVKQGNLTSRTNPGENEFLRPYNFKNFKTEAHTIDLPNSPRTN